MPDYLELALKPLDLPVRISTTVGLARKHPAEEVARTAFGELKGAVIEMGIGVQKVVAMEDVTLQGMKKAKGIADPEAFTFFAYSFKLHLAKLGVSQSVIRDPRFE
jgi:hypothetical protein